MSSRVSSVSADSRACALFSASQRRRRTSPRSSLSLPLFFSLSLFLLLRRYRRRHEVASQRNLELCANLPDHCCVSSGESPPVEVADNVLSTRPDLTKSTLCRKPNRVTLNSSCIVPSIPSKLPRSPRHACTRVANMYVAATSCVARTSQLFIFLSFFISNLSFL